MPDGFTGTGRESHRRAALVPGGFTGAPTGYGLTFLEAAAGKSSHRQQSTRKLCCYCTG